MVKKIQKQENYHEKIIARVDKDHRWTGNILQKIAEEFTRYGIPPEDVMKNDLSEKLLKEVERAIINREIVKIQINGKVRLGKSTLAILLSEFIDNILKKHGKKNKSLKFGVTNICRDQNEYLKKMRDPELMNDILMTDENNKSENTGENATVEAAQRETISDVQAGRYVHSVFVCPDGNMDNNTDIKIEIRNRDKGLIHTRVSYLVKSTFFWGWVPIGVADFNVSKLIKKWLEVEPRFMKYLKYRNDTDRKYIEYWSERDFYVDYMCKKYEKMELMNREGIMHSRDLDYADIRDTIVNQLKPLASLLFISTRSLNGNIRSKIESKFRKRKMPLSMLGVQAEAERITGFLNLYRNLAETQANISGIVNKFKRNKITEKEYNASMSLLKEAEEELNREIRQQEQSLKRLVELNKRYNKIL